MTDPKQVEDWRRFCKEVEDVPLTTYLGYVQYVLQRDMNEKLALDGVTTIGSEDDPEEGLT
jgi:hypothetical protein